MSNKDKIDLYRFITERYEVSSEEIEKEFAVNVGRQLNVIEQTGTPGAGPNPNGTGGSNGRRAMSDEEYVKRYGRPRASVNFLRERGS